MINSKVDNLMIDSDLGFDCDDAGAIALSCVAHNNREIRLLAVTHSTGERMGAHGIESILNHYGVAADIGISSNCTIDIGNFGKNFYSNKKFIDGFKGYDPPPDFYEYLRLIDKKTGIKRTDYEAADTLMLRKLSEVDDNSTTLLFIGQQNNLSSILSDTDSGYGGLTRYALVKKKVKRIVVMGGNFLPYRHYYEFGEVCWEAEFNILSDIRSAKACVGKRDIPFVYVDFNQGVNVYSGGALLKQRRENPAGMVYDMMGGRSRSSWDIVAALYAIWPEHTDFALSEKGVIRISDSGRTSFSAEAGEHRLAYLIKDAQSVSRRIEGYLGQEVAVSPVSKAI